MHCRRTRHNGHKMQQERFQLHTRKKILPSEGGQILEQVTWPGMWSPPTEISITQPEKALNNLTWPCFEHSWVGQSPDVSPNLNYDYTFSDGDLCFLFCLSEQEMSACAGLLTLKQIESFIQYVATKMHVNPSQAYTSLWSQGAVQRQVHCAISTCLDTALFITEPSHITSFTDQISDQGSAGTGLLRWALHPCQLMSCFLHEGTCLYVWEELDRWVFWAGFQLWS